MENEKEIVTLYRTVLIDVYDKNPYKQAETEDGLTLSDEFINSDSGQIDKKDFYIECAKVIEAGPECKYVKPGDDVLIDIRTMSPIPFYGKVYWVLDEGAVKAVIGTGLKERISK